MSVGTAVDSRLDWGRIHLQVLSVLLGRIQLLTGVWTEDLSSLLAGGQRPSSVPGHMGLSMGLSFIINSHVYYKVYWEINLGLLNI